MSTRRYFANGEVQEIHESEVDRFTDDLHKANNKYLCDTGRIATHFVLGKLEQAQFGALMEIMKTRGQLPPDAPLTNPTFCGLSLLKSARESALFAVEAWK